MLALLLAAAVTSALSPASHAPSHELARLPRPILALSFVSSERLLVLDDEQASLFRLTSTGMTKEAAAVLPAPAERVRRPGGMIHGAAGGPDFWVMRSGWTQAVLVTYQQDGARVELAAGEAAAAIPWPGATNGVRFRAGTNLIEGEVRGLGAGPFLALSEDGTIAVDAEGALHLAESDAIAEPACVGSALAHPWADVVLTSSPSAGGADALLAVELAEDGPLRISPLLETTGPIRALAALPGETETTIAIAVDDGDAHVIVRFDVSRRRLTGRR